MTSPTLDRRQGLVGNTPVKAPVDCATTANIVLSGEQVVDGFQTASSRVLVKNQADATKNGIYDTGTGNWTRSRDADGTYDFVQGSMVLVNGGATYTNWIFRLSTPKPVVGSTTLDWGVVSSTINLSSSLGAGQIGYGNGVTYGAGTVGGVFNGADVAANFRANLLLAGNGPWANPAVTDTQHLFEIVNDNTAYQCFAMNAYGALTNGNNIHMNRYRGTLAAPTAIQSGDYFMSWGYRGWDGTATLSQSMAAFQYQATENWTSTAHGGRFKLEVTKTGSSTRLPAWKLYAGATDGAIMELGDETSAGSRFLNASTTGFLQVHGSQDQNGAQSIWYGHAHATTPDETWTRSLRYQWQLISGTEVMRLTAAGLSINKGADANYALEIKSFGANAFNVTASGGTAMLYSTNGSGVFASGENAAASSLYVRKDGTSSRSINAAGTINASGADYAEYVRKADGCGPIAKGAIVGIDVNGNLTDKWAAAISFVVKSTNPSYVGGDVWGHADALGIEQPVEPVFTPQSYGGVDGPGPTPEKPEDYEAPIPAPIRIELPDEASDELIAAVQVQDLLRAQEYGRYLFDREARIAEYAERAEAHAAAADAFQADRAAYAEAVASALERFEAEDMTAYRAALASFQAAHELARQTVDRIAFSGQVPVNVPGAKPGDYIVPEPDGDGIKGVAVTKPTFEQYQAAVGRVIAIEADGRARIIVKVA